MLEADGTVSRLRRLVGRRPGRSRRFSPRSPPTRSNCRWTHQGRLATARPIMLDEGFGSYSSRSVVMGGSAIVSAAAPKLREAIRASRRRACSAARRMTSRSMEGRAVGAEADGRFRSRPSPALSRRRHLRQQQAHLQLRRACRACRGRSQDRPCRAARLRRGRGCRPHHQSADAARPDRRRDRAGARRRVSRASRLRRGRPVADRLARRLSAADRERLSQHPRPSRWRTSPSPNNPLGAKGAGEGGIIPVGGVIANAVAAALARSASSRASCRFRRRASGQLINDTTGHHPRA